MNRKKEIILAIIIVLAILIFIGVNLFRANSDEDKILEDLKTALKERDMSVLKEHLVYENGDKILEDDINRIIKAAEDNQIVLHKAMVYDEDIEFEDEYYRNPFFFKKDGKKRFIYDDYKMVFSRYDLVININDENVSDIKVFIDDEEIKDLERIDNKYICFGVSPGNHILKVKFGDEFKHDVEMDISLLEEGERTLDLSSYGLDESKNLSIYDFSIPICKDVDLESKYVNIYTNIEKSEADVYLYVNGDKTDIKLGTEYYEYGPFFEGEEIKLQAKMKIEDEEYSSQVVDLSVDDFGECFLEIDYIPIDQSERESQVRAVIDNYLIGLVESINSGSMFYVDEYILAGSPIDKTQRKLVDDLYSNNTGEKLLGYEIINIDSINDDEYRVRVIEDHRIYYDSGKDEEVSNEWIYTVKFQDGNAYVYDLKRP